MRVLQVVALISPSGEYGGPVTVALSQSAALRAAGVDVEIAAGSRGYTNPPTSMEGTPAHLFPVSSLPGMGFAGLRSRPMRVWLREHVADFDLVHIHLARDLVTMPAARIARRAGIPFVAQPHGMIMPSDHPLAGAMDRALTRPVLRSSSDVMTLTPEEARGLTEVGATPESLIRLPNGVTASSLRADLTAREVIYVARLQERKRPQLFVEAAHTLLTEFPDWTFTLVGPDEGEGESVRGAIGDETRIRWEGALTPADVRQRLARASVYCLPSINEPFPMSTLEAMSVGLPIVITDTNGLAPLIGREEAGHVVDPSIDQLVSGLQSLMTDIVARRAASTAALRLADQKFTMGAVAEQLIKIYDLAVA